MCTDPNRLRLEMVDDMINVSGKAFLGLSISCARCHDHKFDPIPTADYYALAGVFGSTRIVGDFSEYWRDGRVRLLRPLAMPDEVAADDRLRARIAAKKAEQWKYLTDRHAELLARWQADESQYRAAAAQLPQPWTRNFEAEDFDGVYNLRVAELSSEGKVVQVIETLNPVLQWVRYKIEIPKTAQYRLEAFYSADEKSPLTVQVNGTNITEEALNALTGGWDLLHRRWETVADFELRSGLNFLRITRKEGSFPRIDKFRLIRLDADSQTAIKQFAAAKNLNPLILANFLKDAEHPWPTVAGITAYLDGDSIKAVEAMDGDIDRLAAQIAPRPMIVAVSDQPAPADLPIHLRGSVEAVGPESDSARVPRLFDTLISRPGIASSESGRLQLARWIVDPRNPLTARVIVNRLWQWHFGQGIVQTPNDFGSRGSPPTHPQLLDWLASELVDGGWSLKKLHRVIMLSNTYRMSGDADPSHARG